MRPLLQPMGCGRFDARWFVPVLVGLPLLVLAASGRSQPDPDDYPHGAFQGDCSECHGAEAWKPVLPTARQRHARSGFPLEGAHAAAECRACHATLDFSQSNRMCASCHEDPHRGELGIDCSRCHGARSFLDPAVLRRMHQLSNFPLTGAHAALDCEGCHRPAASGHLQFVATRAECQACHIDLARSVRSPDHSGFPAECSQCHSTLGWDRGRFDHAATAFPLTGAHVATACNACHGDGVYAGKSTACVSCHRADYDGTTQPAHAAAGFPTECASCHGTTAWAGATFDHDGPWFPIYSGKHRDKWDACSDCHTVATNYSNFTCFSCHPHSDRAKTDDQHNGRTGYVYDSHACYSCHPRGN